MDMAIQGRQAWRWSKGCAIGLLAVILHFSASSLFLAQNTDQQPNTDQINEQDVYQYISAQLQVTAVIKDLTRRCAAAQFSPVPFSRRRIEPALFLAFLTILNTDSRIGITDKTAIMQQIAHFCDVNSPPLLWLFATVYEVLVTPSLDVNKLTALMAARRQTQSEVMTALQKVGIFAGASIAPGIVEPIVRDIPTGQISQSIELFVLGASSAASARDAAIQGVRTNLPIPQQRPNSPGGPQLDPTWLAAISARVDTIAAAEWNAIALSVCQRLKQMGQSVGKC
jgi:hypothetical protein